MRRRAHYTALNIVVEYWTGSTWTTDRRGARRYTFGMARTLSKVKRAAIANLGPAPAA